MSDISKIRSPEGCHDFLPQDQVFLHLIKKVIRRRCRQAGIARITPCVFEESSLFERAMGQDTDAVSKELYRFTTASGKKTYALRPELTAGMVRSYIEHGMSSLPQPVRLYAFEQVFRHDRPQKNRYRQFFQWSTEIIGERDPGVDAQMIHLAYNVLKDLRIEKNVVVMINTLGQLKEREKYVEALREYYEGKRRYLSFESQERITTNPLRILDSKDEDDKVINDLAPKFSLFLSEDSKHYFEEVLSLLDAVGVPYAIDERLVRGLDYYNDTVFEFVSTDESSSQGSLLGGGRYDGLVEQLGGVPTPAFGFGLGVERIINRMKEYKYSIPTKDTIHIYVAQLGSHAKHVGFKLLDELHNSGVLAMGAVGTPSIKSQLKNADKFQAEYAIIIGQKEAQDGVVILRDMKHGSQETLPLEGIVSVICDKIGHHRLQKIDFFELLRMEVVEDFEF